MNIPRYLGLLSVAALLATQSTRAQAPVNFESPQAHAVAISSDGQRLYAVNTPGHLLAVYSIANARVPVLVREIPVGLEPISVALQSKTRAWVVNHVSDSVSVVDLEHGTVIDTIDVLDEPGDIAFAGSPQHAFVTSMTERAVLVIDPVTRKRVREIAVFGDDPRAMLASRDGRTLWVAIARSGNKTTIVPHTIAPPPPPPTNTALPPAPRQGILVRSDDPTWRARLGVSLPDHDVIEIDVATFAVRRAYDGVGTTLFNLAQRPGSNELWVANTEARNLVRFEPMLRGHTIDSRITRIQTGSPPISTPVDLNPGIDYSKLPNTAALATALSQPTDVCFAPNGQRAYVASFGTDRIAVLDTNARVLALIEVGNTPGATVAPRTKRGPRALVHHPRVGVIYCVNHLSNSISVIDTAAQKVVRELSMFDPTAQVVKQGRGFLYDAKLSGNGTNSCASCHIDARTDGLAWDLGDPGGRIFNNGKLLHPMKGPLLTQTMQGLGGERIFHWRADRPGLASFNGTFDTLMGGSALDAADLTTFVAYLQSIRFMPNPRRNRDDSLPSTPVGASAKDGERVFLTKQNVGRDGSSQFSCVGCHSNAAGSGGFGFDGLIDQPMKAVQLRGLYKRTGRQKSGKDRTAGFGFGASGTSDDLQAHVSDPKRFNPLTASEKAALERYLLAFAGDFAPSVGFARTIDASGLTNSSVVADVLLLVAQAESSNCDLIGKGILGGRSAGLHYNPQSKRFDRDRASLAALSLAELGVLLSQPGSTITLMGVPRGSGKRLGIDRDVDGTLDGDAGRTRYGAASPPCATVLRLDANLSPRIGRADFAIVASGAPARTGGLLLVSANRAASEFGDLDLLVDLAAAFTLSIGTDDRGEAIVALPIPNDVSLVRARVRLQTVLAASCGKLGLAASSGLELHILR